MMQTSAMRTLATLMIGSLLASIPVSAEAAQETRFDAVRSQRLFCAPDDAPCGRIVAVVNVTAERDSPRRSWDNQQVIQLTPFRTGGTFNTTSAARPATRICTQLRMVLEAAGQIGTTASFGDTGQSLDGFKIATVGSVSTLLGYKCRDINARSAGINVAPENSFVFAGGRAIDALTISARTTIYYGPDYTLRTNWASDKIVFDD